MNSAFGGGGWVNSGDGSVTASAQLTTSDFQGGSGSLELTVATDNATATRGFNQRVDSDDTISYPATQFTVWVKSAGSDVANMRLRAFEINPLDGDFLYWSGGVVFTATSTWVQIGETTGAMKLGGWQIHPNTDVGAVNGVVLIDTAEFK